MRVDRLSKLPDEILIKILSDLPTKCSVRTSVLSQRWKSLWSHVPTLDLDYHDFLYVDDYDEEVFTGLISSFLKSNQDLDLDTFKLAYHVYAHHNDVFEGWINVAIKRRIRHLNVVNESESEEIVRMPLSLYQCKTLVSLSLHHLHLDDDDDDDNTSFSLPCLERMHLEMIKFAGDLTLENLITSCESLRELTIIRDQDDMLEAINVYSKSLDRFVLNYVAYESLYPMQSVEIDAPRLEYLSLTDHLSERIIVSSIAPFFKVYVDVNFGVEYEYDESLDITDASKTTMIGEFLTAISNVSDIFFSATTLKVLYDYCSVQPLPQFTKLHRLHTLFFESSLEFLPILLESCPNLRSLVLEFHQRSVVTKTKPIKLSTVPQCFQSSLEFVQIMAADTSSKLELATYFLRNCVVLKKLKLSKSFRPILPKIRRILRKHTRIEC